MLSTYQTSVITILPSSRDAYMNFPSGLVAEISMRRALALLGSLSFVSQSREGDDYSISMHPVAHAWAHDRLSVSDRQRSSMVAASMVAFVIPLDPRTSYICRKLRIHALSIVQYVLQFRDRFTRLEDTIMVRIGLLLETAQDSAVAIKIFRDILTRAGHQYQISPYGLRSLEYFLASGEISASQSSHAIRASPANDK